MKIRKQLTAFSLILILSMNMIGMNDDYIIRSKAATFDEINQPDVFLKQVNGDMQCTLVSATMLIRRAAMLSGNTNWRNITVDEVKKQAWVDGVGIKYTFTYEGITVNKATFGKDPVNEAIALLQEHPEGIVLFDQYRSPRSHAVLLTDYTDEMFYCADPSDAVPYGRIPINEGLVQVESTEFYYYVSSPSIPSPTPSMVQDNGAQSSIIANTDTNTNSNINTNPNTFTDINPNIITDTTNTVTATILDTATKSVTDISAYEVQLSQTDYYYDGKEKKPGVFIAGLVENTDYTVTYINNVNVGSAAIIIKGVGDYFGIIIKSFEIREATEYDYFNEIKAELGKQTIKKDKTTTVKVTIPETLTLVKEFSSGGQSSNNNEVKISYTSSNSKIAKVNSKGKITGKKKGNAKICVTAELADGTKKEFTLVIKVKD